ncbi:MmcQ/YjbR family DNA-binding protein [Dickeya chrysanthemi]|nr:MmcQ/YjbR family DNA-binding protein [Dickeya chrysanthemi]WJM87508.1 MmcQ/YjbR family DNA-binding protein [Dickeya chrysanthemi]
MNAEQFFDGIARQYGVLPDYPWKNSSACVFRHPNRKWFCLNMTVKNHQLGREGNDDVEIINVKARPEMIGSLRSIKGVLPAYHMNKEHWLSIVLQEIDTETLWQLVSDSHLLTA